MDISLNDVRKGGAFCSLLLCVFVFLFAPTVARANISSDTDEMPDGTRQIDVERIVESKTDNGSIVPVVIDSDGTAPTVGNQVANLPKVGKTIKAQYKDGRPVGRRKVMKAELKDQSDVGGRKLLARVLNVERRICIAIVLVTGSIAVAIFLVNVH